MAPDKPRGGAPPPETIGLPRCARSGEPETTDAPTKLVKTANSGKIDAFQHLEMLRVSEAYPNRSILANEAERLFFAYIAEIAERDAAAAVLAVAGIPGAGTISESFDRRLAELAGTMVPAWGRG
jgi:hypothetical protein